MTEEHLAAPEAFVREVIPDMGEEIATLESSARNSSYSSAVKVKYR